MDETKEKTDKGYKWGDISKKDLVRIEFPSGNHLELLKADDMYFPLQIENGNYVPDLRLNLPRIRQMEARDDDVLICAYPRSGMHLTFEIVNMLIRGKAEYINEDKDSTELELHLPEEFDDLRSPRILSTHYEFHHIPQDMIDKKYPFMSWYRSTLNWEQVKLKNPSLPIFSLYYEELKKNPCNEIRKLAEFLEVKYDDDLIRDIAEKYHFENMKNAKVNLRVSEIQKMEKGVGFVKDKEKWIHAVSNVLYRKGDVDDWKNWFTVAQNEQFDKTFKENMKHSKLIEAIV